ncbi:hypothetical protein E1263_06160 [Kribbella antibiotica]|uniref:Uncharacterized protein n=1 Tax=Kribbella antibiotica TaxID=190195 RepID=A0A4R4ZRZ6_9ACTN|nr:hypothetical protein [Kribbella antibiotica]TDD61773.1 hypothetical protein E1263_06160 [Kribbella antibiotica]
MTAQLPVARTHDEAILWLNRQPCAGCSTTTENWEHGLTQSADGELLIAYDTTCAGCRQDREYFFELPERETRLGAFGGPEPSELLDAGQWLGLADELASRVPVDDQAARTERLKLAAAAVDEVLKFVPVGEDDVPDLAFWTEEGRQVRDQQPGRFRRLRLEVVLATYRP